MKKILLLSSLFFLIQNIQAQNPCALDPSFSGDGTKVNYLSRIADQLAYQDDGKIITACNSMGNGTLHVKRILPDGSFDPNYASWGSRTIEALEVRTTSNAMVYHMNETYIGGTTTTNIGGTKTYAFLACLDSNGNFKTTFGNNGIKIFNGSPKINNIESVILSNDGHLLTVSLNFPRQIQLTKHDLQTGNLMPSFNTDGIATYTHSNSNENLDVRLLTQDVANNIIVAGSMYKPSSALGDFFEDLCVAKFDDDGVIDGTFANNGLQTYRHTLTSRHQARNVHTTASNDYLITSMKYLGQGSNQDYGVLKISANGIEDASYGSNGWSVLDIDNMNGMDALSTSELLPDERLLLNGGHGDGDTVKFCLLMLNNDGTRDLNFGTNGYFEHILENFSSNGNSSLAIHADGKIATGGFTRTCANGVCGPLYLAFSQYTFDLGAPLGMTDKKIDLRIATYPNPIKSDQAFRINTSKQIIRAYAFDLYGRSINLNQSNAKTYSISAPAGLYYAVFETEENETLKSKIIISE